MTPASAQATVAHSPFEPTPRDREVAMVQVPALGGLTALAFEQTPLGVAVAAEGSVGVVHDPEQRFEPARRLLVRQLPGRRGTVEFVATPEVGHWQVLGILDVDDCGCARRHLEQAGPETFPGLPWVAWRRIHEALSKETSRKLRGFPLPYVDVTAQVRHGTARLPANTPRFARAWAGVQEALLRDNCRAVLLDGKAGVGKSAFVRYLASQVVEGRVAARLQGLTVLSLDASLFESFRNQEVELQRVAALTGLAELPVLVNIDEAHRLQPTSSSSDALDVIKMMITEHGLRLLLCTNAPHLLLGRDQALARRLTCLSLEEASSEETLSQVLPTQAMTAQQQRSIRVEPSTFAACLVFSRLIGRHAQPHAAVALLHQTLARAERTGRGLVNEATVQEVGLELLGGLPQDLEECRCKIAETLVGHEEPIRQMLVWYLAHRNRQTRVHAHGTGRPFCCVVAGPPGVGKSSLCRALQQVHGGQANEPFVIRGADYQRRENLNTLLGAPPAFIGHGGRGALFEALQGNPRAVVEFAEPEHACPELVLRVLAPMLEGSIVGNEGNQIGTSGLCLILTTNAGVLDRPPVGFAVAREEQSGTPTTCLEALQRVLPAPVRSRIGRRVLYLPPLGAAELREIARRLLDQLAEREAVEISPDAGVLDALVEKAQAAQELGVRALEQAFADELAAPIESLLATSTRVSRILVRTVDGELVVGAQET
jgi:ATP-dependent Clp protease ATP-binding subunit ClpC